MIRAVVEVSSIEDISLSNGVGSGNTLEVTPDIGPMEIWIHSKSRGHSAKQPEQANDGGHLSSPLDHFSVSPVWGGPARHTSETCCFKDNSHKHQTRSPEVPMVQASAHIEGSGSPCPRALLTQLCCYDHRGSMQPRSADTTQQRPASNMQKRLCSKTLTQSDTHTNNLDYEV